MENTVTDSGDKPVRPYLRYIQTSSVFLSIFTLGLVAAILGTALIDLAQLFETSIKLVTQINVTRAAGLLFGSLISSSVLYRFINGKICIIFAMILGGLGNALVPSNGSLIGAHVCLFIAGTSVGVLEVGGNVWLVQLWKDKVAPVFQMYHLSFGIGALISPVITEPFLSPTDMNAAVSGNVTANSETRIAIPFGLFGGAYACVGLFMLALFFIDPSNLRQDDPASKDSNDETKTTPRAFFEWLVVAHLVLYIFVQVSVESTIAQMLGVYAVSNEALNFTKSSASFLFAVFWTLYTSGRVTALLLSFKIRPFYIIAFMHTLSVLGTVLLVALGVTTGQSLWVSIGIMGFGLAPLYASVMSWAVRYVRLRYVHMTMVIVASCMGQMLPPLTVGLWVKDDPGVFIYVIAGWMTIHTVNLVAMYKNTNGHAEIFANEADIKAAAAASAAANNNDINMDDMTRDGKA